jgi:hypothetical protein
MKDQPNDILYPKPIVEETVSRLCVSTRTSCEGLSCLRCPRPSGQASTRYFTSKVLMRQETQTVVEYFTGDRFSPEFMERRRLE